MTLAPSDSKTASKARVNFESRSRMRKRTPVGSASSMKRLRACWVTIGGVGIASGRRYVNTAGPDVDEEQDVEGAKESRLHGEEVAGEHPISLQAKEL
jgi:hypothetical protein